MESERKLRLLMFLFPRWLPDPYLIQSQFPLFSPCNKWIFFLFFPLTEKERECQNSESYSNDDKDGPSLHHQVKVLRNTQGVGNCCPISPKSQTLSICFLFTNKQTTNTLEAWQLSSVDANCALFSPIVLFLYVKLKNKMNSENAHSTFPMESTYREQPCVSTVQGRS